MTATLAIPSVGEGHIEVKFDNKDVAETLRAERIVEDMLKRGYIIIVETAPGEWERATSFDPKTNCYVLADGPSDQERDYDANSPTSTGLKSETTTKSKAKAKGRSRRVPAKSANAVGVSKTAGG